MELILKVEFTGTETDIVGKIKDALAKDYNVNTDLKITIVDVDSLLADSNKLHALEGAGVDNWDGYETALEIYEESL